MDMHTQPLLPEVIGNILLFSNHLSERQFAELQIIKGLVEVGLPLSMQQCDILANTLIAEVQHANV